MSNTIDLALDGLSCGHCVKRVKRAWSSVPTLSRRKLPLPKPTSRAAPARKALIETIKQAGYGAELQPPKG